MKLLKFSMKGCGPCIALKKTVDALKGEPLIDNIQEIDAAEDFELSAKYGIRSVPVMILTDDHGNLLKRQQGFMTAEQLRNFIKE